MYLVFIVERANYALPIENDLPGVLEAQQAIW